jgi:hypothetical protein
MFRLFLVAAAAALGFVCSTQAAFAATITSYTLPSGAIIPVSTPQPNITFGQSANPNVISLPGASAPSISFDSLNPIDIPFACNASSGVTEYFIQEIVSNHSGVDWNGFKLLLGIGTGATFSGPFTASSTITTFGYPPFAPAPTSSTFSTLGPPSIIMEWSGAVLPSGADMNLTLSILATDFPLNLTLRSFPIAVPEPATIVLFAVGAAGLLIANLRS